MHSPQPSARAEAQRLFAQGHTAETIAARCGVHPTTVRRWAKKGCWQRPSGRAGTTRRAPASLAPPSADDLQSRIRRLMHQQLIVMENGMNEDDPGSAADALRNLRTLGSIERNIDRMKERETGTGNAAATDPKHRRRPDSPEEEERLRNEIVERLLRLRERKGARG